ncbi:helix-turn-helix transcriptional regulator [Lysinibacillus irui]|uniref:Phage protein n=2 Tax=Lysinibacillus TaxID=400634 RepID=A0A2X0XEB7_9BACI|nr:MULTISPECIES: helix-turn-helix transcriptional regulator [Lysinibacillus]MEA0555598.1 helix-turn-helix transcriptional regulator [Lysinibacillus irui]MEA0977183.1 helix-turn-helix transcriptional regulator [Lysinibacillus irui]MEA1043337.1 helix-turn-helix transcriptional regulator [Lysinibacillus irui]SPT95603.1 Phage protein [Lysinibacillus capsici]
MNKRFPNLEAELARQGIQRKDIAEKIGVRVATVSDKLNGKYPFTLDEATAIKNIFFPNLSMDYLFSGVANVAV